MSDIESVQASKLSQLPGVRHGFFTRLGGVSAGIYATLNCGLGSGDDPQNVLTNRSRVCQHLNPDEITMTGVHQVHGKAVHVITSRAMAAARPQADGLVTSQAGIALSVLAADCAPVLFADPRAGIIGAAHAGWKGALAGVCEAVVDAMLELGATREAIFTAIGPCISQNAYEVDAAFETNFLTQDPASAEFFAAGARADKRQFALGRYVGARLARARIGGIERLDLCTYSDERRFFSFRRSTHCFEQDYGRCISAIVLD